MTQRTATTTDPIVTAMRLVRDAVAGMSRLPRPDLRMHLISAHCSPVATCKTPDELERDHRHEHDGPGTIRNHGRKDLAWNPAKVIEVLDEALEME